MVGTIVLTHTISMLSLCSNCCSWDM